MICLSRCRSLGIRFFGLVFILLALLFLYDISMIRPTTTPTEADLVLVYGGEYTRIPPALEIARQLQVSYFIYSDDESYDLQQSLKKFGSPGKARVITEDHAVTTDQNARFTAPMIRQLPVKKVLLVTSWSHMPRALFLTRLYLLESPVSVYPYASDKPPAQWWATRAFWGEYLKFWGSLGRVALSWVGIENWPKTGSS